MTESEAIAVARRVNDLFASIPFEELRAAVLEAETFQEAIKALGDQVPESLLDVIDPEIEVDIGEFMGGAALAGGGGRGYDAWLLFWKEWLEPWEELVFEPLDYETGGTADEVLVHAHVSAKGRLSGVPAELEVWQAWTVRDGRVVVYGVHPSRELALGAA